MAAELAKPDGIHHRVSSGRRGSEWRHNASRNSRAQIVQPSRIGTPGSNPSGAYPRLADALILGGAYLYGSLPLVYLLGRRRNVDLKRIGSGNVGATNLMAAGGPVRAAAGWLFDASKGLLPVLVARRMGRREEMAELAGVCGVVGQCWPVFLGFQGGRGISAYVGATAAIRPRAWPAALLPMIVGGLWRVGGRFFRRRQPTAANPPARSKSMPLGCFVSTLAYPLVCDIQDGFDPRRAVAPSLLSFVLLARRLTASLPDDPTDGPAVHPRALLFRLLYDRNTSM